ncbi:MAG: HNH endonuclease [Halobacteriales archaeon]
MPEHECPECDRVFDTRRGLGVHHSHAHDERLPNRVCGHCGTRFYSEYDKKYCSRECLLESDSYAGENNPHYQGKKETTDCELCGEQFEYYPSDKRGLYCPDCVETERWRDPPTTEGADNPGWDGGKRKFACAVCDNTVERHPSNTGEVVVCSEACRREWLSEAFTGEGHPNWQGGGSGSYGRGWNRVRREALERDDYECVACGRTKAEIGRNPDVHHIRPVREFVESETRAREDAHALDNVVSLCVDCHRKADFGKIPAGELREAAGIGE